MTDNNNRPEEDNMQFANEERDELMKLKKEELVEKAISLGVSVKSRDTKLILTEGIIKASKEEPTMEDVNSVPINKEDIPEMDHNTKTKERPFACTNKHELQFHSRQELADCHGVKVKAKDVAKTLPRANRNHTPEDTVSPTCRKCHERFPMTFEEACGFMYCTTCKKAYAEEQAEKEKANS